MSTPTSLSSRASATDWSISQPPSTYSLAESRTMTGSAAGNDSRTARATSTARRVRRSNVPPYSSVRRLVSGDRNSCSR